MIKVGFDIDGVLRELFPCCLNIFIENYPSLKKDIVPYSNVKTYELDSWFKYPELKKQFDEYVFKNKETSYDIYVNAPIISTSICFNRLIDKLRDILKDKIQIILITDQSYSHQKEATCRWLDINNINNFDALIFAKDKHKFDLKYLLDDYYIKCKLVNNCKGNGILYKQIYNISQQKDFISVNNIKEYIDMIIKNEKNK